MQAYGAPLKENYYWVPLVFLCSSQYAPTHHGAQQGRQPAGHLTCVRHGTLPQRWYWDIVVQVRDVIRQFT
ncbi:hypothetical protein TNCV_4390361 [Trichonephila clavipes]|nr:hypothetical protein TNCV_4390361 [Trichonephila clavipes]